MCCLHNPCTAGRTANVHHGYHAHVHFDTSTLEQARAPCDQAGALFKVAVGRLHMQNVGSSTRWSRQTALSAEHFDHIVPWLGQRRGGPPAG